MNMHLIDNDKAHHLVIMIDIFHMDMVLPATEPTLEAINTKNLTWPDNTFCSANLTEQVSMCRVEPAHRPVKTNRLINITPQRAFFVAWRNYRAANWEKVREDLEKGLSSILAPTEISSVEEFHSRLNEIHSIIEKVEDDHVPMIKDTPFQNWWYNSSLKEQCKQVQKLWYTSENFCNQPDHLVHKEY